MNVPRHWRLPEFVRRSFHTDQMEVDSALSQMWSLCTSPSVVFKLSKARKITKNHYHRDDPAFIVLQALFLSISAVAFGLALRSAWLHIAYMILYQFGISYVAVGAVVATATWSFANKFLMGRSQLHEVRKDMEWQYAFDIHCNGYFPYFVCTHVLQFFLLPILRHDTFVAQLVANLLYGFGACAYCYVTFRGFLELPMLTRQQLFLYPIGGIVALAVLATLTTHINMTHFMIYQSWSL